MILYQSDFLENKPDYVFQGLDFICTCGSYPEQYDVLLTGSDNILYQVGYVRLRGGRLSCSFPDAGHPIIYEYKYYGLIGSFTNEQERVYHLNNIAIKIKQTLEGISYGYS